MLDKDIAELYSVETKTFNRAVKRNKKRFPEDFMFQLTAKEYENLRYHFGTSSWGGRRYIPYAFTEQGVAMLSSVLNSDKAIQINIQIIKTFVKMREMIISNKELRQKLEEMERKYDTKFQVVFKALRKILEPKNETQRQIGFNTKI